MINMIVMYPNAPDKAFDMDYSALRGERFFRLSSSDTWKRSV